MSVEDAAARRDRARALLAQTNTDDRRQIYLAFCQLGGHRREIVPLVSEAFSATRHWRGRESHVYYVTPYARFDEAAVELGLRALSDGRKEVRYRACGLLAHSRRRETVGELQKAERGLTQEPARRAIRALQEGVPFGPDDDASYFFYGNDPHRAPRGSFASALFDEVDAWASKQGFSPSYLFQHTLELVSERRIVRAEWDSYDVEARILVTEAGGAAPFVSPVPDSVVEIAAAIRREVSRRHPAQG